MDYCKCLERGDEPNRVIQDCHEYIDAREIELYTLKEPLSIGKYLIPFQLVLPENIPASFSKKSECGPEWFIQVYYGLQAEFLGINAEKAECDIQVFEKGDFEEENTSVSKEIDIGKWFSKGNLKIRAYIDSPEYILGNVIKLSLDFIQLGSCEAHIAWIDIKLKNELKIIFGKERFVEIQQMSPLRDLVNGFQFGGVSPMYSGSYVKPTKAPYHPPDSLWPELGPVILWSTHLSNSPEFNLMKGLDQLHIPLTATNTPSCNARYSQSKFSIDLDIQVNDHKVALNIPVPRVKLKDKPLHKEPDWVSDKDCKLILSQHEAKVVVDDKIERHFCNLPKTSSRLKRTMISLSVSTDDGLPECSSRGNSNASVESESYVPLFCRPIRTGVVFDDLDSFHLEENDTTPAHLGVNDTSPAPLRLKGETASHIETTDSSLQEAEYTRLSDCTSNSLMSEKI